MMLAHRNVNFVEQCLFTLIETLFEYEQGLDRESGHEKEHALFLRYQVMIEVLIEIGYKNGRVEDSEDAIFIFIETHLLLSKNYLLNRDINLSKLINMAYNYIVMLSIRDPVKAFEFMY